MRLDATIALVTGAAGGIGRAVCDALAAAGATVIASDLTECSDVVCAVQHCRHDASSEADWKRIAQDCEARHGRLDVLVNAAGIAYVAKIEETSLDSWRKVQAVNVESILLGMQAMLPLLRKSGTERRGGAAVVNFSSVGGLRGAALNSAYCASKAAVTLLSKCAAIEFAALGYGIRVNSVHPGGIETEMLAGMMQRYVDLGFAPSREASHASIAAAHPIGRLGTTDEIGSGVVYLCSPDASFVTGSELVIDGGYTAR